MTFLYFHENVLPYLKDCAFQSCCFFLLFMNELFRTNQVFLKTSSIFSRVFAGFGKSVTQIQIIELHFTVDIWIR